MCHFDVVHTYLLYLLKLSLGDGGLCVLKADSKDCCLLDNINHLIYLPKRSNYKNIYFSGEPRHGD